MEQGARAFERSAREAFGFLAEKGFQAGPSRGLGTSFPALSWLGRQRGFSLSYDARDGSATLCVLDAGAVRRASEGEPARGRDVWALLVERSGWRRGLPGADPTDPVSQVRAWAALLEGPAAFLLADEPLE